MHAAYYCARTIMRYVTTSQNNRSVFAEYRQQQQQQQNEDNKEHAYVVDRLFPLPITPPGTMRRQCGSLTTGIWWSTRHFCRRSKEENCFALFTSFVMRVGVTPRASSYTTKQNNWRRSVVFLSQFASDVIVLCPPFTAWSVMLQRLWLMRRQRLRLR